MEYFYDHARIEQMLFEGAVSTQQGMLQPDLESPGTGLTVRKDVAMQYSVSL
jgi:hypothetical protein